MAARALSPCSPYVCRCVVELLKCVNGKASVLRRSDPFSQQRQHHAHSSGSKIGKNYEIKIKEWIRNKQKSWNLRQISLALIVWCCRSLTQFLLPSFFSSRFMFGRLSALIGGSHRSSFCLASLTLAFALAALYQQVVTSAINSALTCIRAN